VNTNEKLTKKIVNDLLTWKPFTSHDQVYHIIVNVISELSWAILWQSQAKYDLLMTISNYVLVLVILGIGWDKIADMLREFDKLYINACDALYKLVHVLKYKGLCCILQLYRLVRYHLVMQMLYGCTIDISLDRMPAN